MTGSTVVCEVGIAGVCGSTRGRKSILDESAETPQQRFADMLPIADAAREEQPEEVAAGHENAGDSDDGKESENVVVASDDPAEESEDKSTEESDLAARVSMELMAWCLADTQTPVSGAEAVSADAEEEAVAVVQSAGAELQPGLPGSVVVSGEQTKEPQVPQATRQPEANEGSATSQPALEQQLTDMAEVAGPPEDGAVSAKETDSFLQAVSRAGEAVDDSLGENGQEEVEEVVEGVDETTVAPSRSGDVPDVQKEIAKIQAPEKRTPSVVEDSTAAVKEESKPVSPEASSLGDKSAADVSAAPESAFTDGEWDGAGDSEPDTLTEEMVDFGDGDQVVDAEQGEDDSYVTISDERTSAWSELSVSSIGESTVHSVSEEADSASTARGVAQTPVRSVGEQILDSMRASIGQGEKEILIRLNPPEMGSVVVRLQENGNQVSGVLEVGTTEARREIERALPEVIQGLQEAGVQIRRIEVLASDQPRQDLSGESSSQDALLQQRNSEQGREQSAMASPTRWLQGMGDQAGSGRGIAADESEIVATVRGRIDLLM